MTNQATSIAVDYKVRFGTLNAFFWIWVKRNNFTRRKLVIMLILAALMTVLSGQPIISAMWPDVVRGKISPLMICVFVVVMALTSIVMSSIIMYVVSPALSYIVQVLGYVFGPLRHRINTVDMDASGLHRPSVNGTGDLAWNKVHDVVATKSSILIFTNRNCAVMIPKSAFATPGAADVFAQSAIKYWTDAKSIF